MQDVELIVLFPVLLQSDAYPVYDGLGEEHKKDASKIEDVLLQAFSLDVFAPYELFTKRKMSNEKRVDFFLADLKRLACLARLPDEAVQLAFVVGCAAPKRNVWYFKYEEMGHVAAKCTKQQENEEKSDRCALARSRTPAD